MLALGLDFATFGNGHGMGQPFFDGVFYWLVDTANDHTRNEKRGRFYKWSGWFGCQLRSYQWTHPNAGERRILNDREYRVFGSRRQWLRVEVTWRLVEMDRGGSIDVQNELLRRVHHELSRL